MNNIVLGEKIRENCIAFSMWEQSLAKSGYPRTDKGHMMNVWQLYDYWDKKVNKTPYLIHARSHPTSPKVEL